MFIYIYIHISIYIYTSDLKIWNSESRSWFEQKCDPGHGLQVAQVNVPGAPPAELLLPRDSWIFSGREASKPTVMDRSDRRHEWFSSLIWVASNYFRFHVLLFWLVNFSFDGSKPAKGWPPMVPRKTYSHVKTIKKKNYSSFLHQKKNHKSNCCHLGVSLIMGIPMPIFGWSFTSLSMGRNAPLEADLAWRFPSNSQF